ncbi:MAG: DUF971 domain-containing protein [Acidobacteria bacterium]|nr:MAG: DUF971 domain-containing protein [Acidobacteriota bacterium]
MPRGRASPGSSGCAGGSPRRWSRSPGACRRGSAGPRPSRGRSTRSSERREAVGEVVPRAIEIFPNGEIGIAWSDGREDIHPPARLRRACPCAECVDELTGRRRYDPARIPDDLRATGWKAVGGYGVRFDWSDGHDTGIYSFEYLRALGEAPHPA